VIEGVIKIVSAPSSLLPGASLKIKLHADLFDESRWATDYWVGTVKVSGNGYEEQKSFNGLGDYIGTDVAMSFGLGLMPQQDAVIKIELYGQDLGIIHNFYGFPPPLNAPTVMVASEVITVAAISQGGGDDDDDDDGGGGGEWPSFFEEFPWKWAGVAAGAVFAGLLIRRIRE